MCVKMATSIVTRGLCVITRNVKIELGQWRTAAMISKEKVALKSLKTDDETQVEDNSKQVPGMQLQPREQIVEIPIVQHFVEYRFRVVCRQRMIFKCWSEDLWSDLRSRRCNPSLLRKSLKLCE